MIEKRAFVRHHLKKALERYSEFTIVGVAKDLVRGFELCQDREPDIIILDGKYLLDEDKDFACKLLATRPMQIIAIADKAIHDHLALRDDSKICLHNLVELDGHKVEKSILDIVGAVLKHDVMIKDIKSRYNQKIKKTYANSDEAIIAIGASTGGVEAIENVLKGLRGDTPPILMVQHMSKIFTTKMARRLTKITIVTVKEATQGEYLRRNVAYLAPGDQHMTIEEDKGNYRIKLDTGPMVHYQRPAVENLFESVAKVSGHKSVGILLTGMGKDGAKGLSDMRKAGAYTIAQDAASCVVFGMPHAAIELGAACEVTPINEVAKRIEELSAVEVPKRKIRDAV